MKIYELVLLFLKCYFTLPGPAGLSIIHRWNSFSLFWWINGDLKLFARQILKFDFLLLKSELALCFCGVLFECILAREGLCLGPKYLVRILHAFYGALFLGWSFLFGLRFELLCLVDPRICLGFFIFVSRLLFRTWFCFGLISILLLILEVVF